MNIRYDIISKAQKLFDSFHLFDMKILDHKNIDGSIITINRYDSQHIIIQMVEENVLSDYIIMNNDLFLKICSDITVKGGKIIR